MKNKKLLIIAILLIGIFFLVKSRRVSQSTFDLMVLMEQTEILEVCNNRLIAKQKDPNISFENVSYDNKEFYNYILSKNGDDLCSNTKKLNEVVTEHYKEFFKKEWKFVY
ncbi:hypothetical protein [Leeuwenhoekiella blandensis]|uniref:Uncharacterized protein n=1 Tax=Leeuwenhoekiella blandensis (strain CECT 7118 / CCUG 51940 / KCTC 22103 / MED217) TaxID=398720 RepID=A3XNQ5_LEEBM|nr:hypothetical protein [Leeuwenhoekiella blandensis]EAQ48821.1 hypothetical protein MED217_09742 [Leeuwenhoekiella blandensis MED217]